MTVSSPKARGMIDAAMPHPSAGTVKSHRRTPRAPERDAARRAYFRGTPDAGHTK